jgi:2-oxoglutarate ferredoxin oxidoreductase subunit alpha
MHSAEFTDKTLVFGDDAKNLLPLKELSSQAGSAIHSNTICLGVAAYLLSLDPKICSESITETYGADPANIFAFNLGFEYAQNNYKNLVLVGKSSAKSKHLHIYDGNESFGWGFIKGEGNFYSAYPMTPATGALHFLAPRQSETMTVFHPEDEIAAASLAAGAAFAGARSSVGTSGGGFALMVETVSLCGAANLGVVFYLVSRPGPATGLPTWTSQADLLFAVNAGHGEFNKIVLAPGDQQESFELSAEALNLAARFNLPVIVVSDKFIAESGASLPDLSSQKVAIYRSKLPIPGTVGKEFLANSYEHDESGFSTEDAVQVTKNVLARREQLKQIISAVPKPVFYGSPKAKKLIVSWGSTKSTILEALKIMNDDSYAFLQIKSLWPINPEIELLIKPFKKIIVIENNANSQMSQLLKSQFDFHPTKTILKFDGRPFFPEELVTELSSK